MKDWYVINEKRQLEKIAKGPEKTRDIGPHTQVHVWTQEPLPHSKEEEEWRTRHADEALPDVQWGSGQVVDHAFCATTTNAVKEPSI